MFTFFLRKLDHNYTYLAAAQFAVERYEQVSTTKLLWVRCRFYEERGGKEMSDRKVS